MTRNLTVKVIPKFPARVLAGVGAAISKVNGIWTFAFDSSGIPAQPVTDPANTEVIVEMPDGTLGKVPLSGALAAVQPVEQTGKKNAILNGGFSVWQRGTNFVPTTTRIYTADLWAVKTAAGTLTSAARASTASARGPYGITLIGNVAVTTVDIDQRIEAVNAAALRSLPPYITFSAKIGNLTGSAFTPTLYVETPTVLDNWAASAVQNNGGAGDALQSCPASTVTTVTWSADVTAYTNLANGLAFRLRFPSGSLDVNTKSIQIYDVQVEPVAAVGSAPTLFEVETFADELARCQRYYQKSFPYATVPANNAGSAGSFIFTQVVAASLPQGGNSVRFTTVMRATPTLTLFNPSAANSQIRNVTASTDWTGSNAIAQGDSCFQVSGTTPAGSVAGQVADAHFTADAEL